MFHKSYSQQSISRCAPTRRQQHRRRKRTRHLACLAMLLLIGCAGNAPPGPEATLPTPTLQSATTPLAEAIPSAELSIPEPTIAAPSPDVSTPTSTPESTPADIEPISVLRRAGPPPAGVAEQLAFAEGASGAACLPAETPTITGHPLVVTDIGDICFVGFGAGATIEAEVQMPDGRLRRNRLRANQLGIAGWEWHSAPGDPLGEYFVSARTGDAFVTGSFEVALPTRPWIEVRPPYGPPGTSFEILLAGFPPLQSGYVPLYEEVRTDTYDYVDNLVAHEHLGLDYARFITTVPLSTNERGEASFLLRTGANDPPGSYLVHGGREATSGHFRVLDLDPLTAPDAPARADSLLQRRDPLPAGLAPYVHSEQFDAACYPAAEASVNLLEQRLFAADTFALPYRRNLCLRGFEPQRDIMVEIKRPDGTTHAATAINNADGVALLPVTVLPGDPVGRHDVAARQGAIAAFGSFAVNQAATPLITSFAEPGPPGSAIEVAVAGFRAERPLQLRLYAAEGCGPQRVGNFRDPARYISSLPPAYTDARGEATLTVTTRRDDPPGTYYITDDESQVVNMQRRAARFIVTQPEAPTLAAEPRHAPVGGTITLDMRRFHPGSCITPLLFRREPDDGWRYVTSLTYAIADDNGTAETTIHTLPEDTPGEYLVLTPVAHTRFTLGATQAAPAPSEICGTATVVEVIALAVRAEPSRGAAVLAAVPAGRSVALLCVPEVAADDRTWRRVRFEDVEGWMSARYLRIDQP